MCMYLNNSILSPDIDIYSIIMQGFSHRFRVPIGTLNLWV